MSVFSISWAHEIEGFSDPCNSSLEKQVKEGVIRKISRPTVAGEPLKTLSLQL